jgi:hypothetical protein
MYIEHIVSASILIVIHCTVHATGIIVSVHAYTTTHDADRRCDEINDGNHILLAAVDAC